MTSESDTESSAVPFCASPVEPSSPTRSGWQWSRLTNLARLATGHTPSRAEPKYWNGDIPWLQLPDIRALDGKTAVQTLERTNALGIANSSAVLLPEDTVCMSRTASVGFVAIMGRPMATSQDFVNWVCGPDLSPRFLMYLLIAARRQVRDLGSGAVHHTIYFPTVRQFSVCIPPLAEQERIATRLTEQLAAVERARAAALARLAAAEALPAAYLREVFEGLDASAWQTLPVSEVCNVVEGQVDPREKEYGKLPHVNGENIESGTGRILKVQSAAEDGLISGKYLFEAGMVLYSKLRPYLRKVAVAPFRGVCSADMYPLIFDPERVDTHFAMWSLLAGPFSRYAIKESERARMPKLNREQLYAWNMPLPALDDQRRIAADLSRPLAQAEHVTAIIRDELAAIETLPAALLREAFSGNQSDRD
jgi:restriction endonuclease S subunit